MLELDFKEELIEKILKEYSIKKIDEKLDLLMERKNIKSPAGWLWAALKNDYQGAEQAEQESQPLRIDSRFRLPLQARQTGGNNITLNVIANDHRECGNLKSSTMYRALNPPDKKILSSEEATRRFYLLRHKLMAMSSSRHKP